MIEKFVRRLSPKKKFYDPSGEGMEKWIEKNVHVLRQQIVDVIEKDGIIPTDDMSLGIKMGSAKAALLIHRET